MAMCARGHSLPPPPPQISAPPSSCPRRPTPDSPPRMSTHIDAVISICSLFVVRMSGKSGRGDQPKPSVPGEEGGWSVSCSSTWWLCEALRSEPWFKQVKPRNRIPMESFSADSTGSTGSTSPAPIRAGLCQCRVGPAQRPPHWCKLHQRQRPGRPRACRAGERGSEELEEARAGGGSGWVEGWERYHRPSPTPAREAAADVVPDACAHIPSPARRGHQQQ
jgi:hypothetical protein